ncbi:hypothetical protein F503_02658 [Ophiostoma piceae UAMH 11346]|uniref:LysM domain-containing protein n=1 Tax=Ophiostoma piceae (strain UAMH 11346) TaxID=1262450 RepID=S3CZW7_OPHP1|nr:hypothetical protein F503_02658 [Ophiostoma piceae UAMH 11346]
MTRLFTASYSCLLHLLFVQPFNTSSTIMPSSLLSSVLLLVATTSVKASTHAHNHAHDVHNELFSRSGNAAQAGHIAFIQSDVNATGYNIVEPGTIANGSSQTISSDCMSAVEATVLCDSQLSLIAGSDYFMEQDPSTLEAICTASCASSLADYHHNVAAKCSGQPEAWPGYPATYFGDLVWSSYNLTCLADPTTGSSCMSYLFNATGDSEDVSALDLPDDLLCSPCVLALYRVLQGTAYSYYDDQMASDWKAIQEKCGVTYPTDVTPNPTNVTDIPGFAAPGDASENSTITCLSGNMYTVASGDNCIAISQQNNVSTGTLQILNNIYNDCSNLIAGASVCLPNQCQTYTVQPNDTCSKITSSYGINFSQFRSWNPSINSYCSNIVSGHLVCVGVPGEAYTGTLIPGATATQTAVYATATVPAPSNIAKDTTTHCGEYYTAVSGDNCALIATNNTISIDLFLAINPSLDTKCTNLLVGLAYCVFPTADWNATSSSSGSAPPTTSTLAYVSAPAPTPTGTTSKCYKYHTVVSGDYCGLIESHVVTPGMR